MSRSYSYVDPHNPRDPFGHVQPPQDRSRFVNVHELLKYQMATENDPGYVPRGPITNLVVPQPGPQVANGAAKDAQRDQVAKVQRPLSLPDNQGIIDTFIYFDSDARESSSDITSGRLVYSLIRLNNNNPLDNIIQMNIGDFYVPDIPTGVDFPEYYFFNELTVLIEELQAQSIFAQNNVRFHHQLRAAPAGIVRSCTPTTVGGVYIFGIPFRDVNTITFQFRAPIKTCTFPQDIFTFTAVPGSSPAQITLGAPHGLTIGTPYAIFLRGFSSNIGSIDQLVNSVNGYMMTPISATVLEFPPIGVTGFDFTAVVAPLSGTLTIGYRRIAFKMRFRSIVNKETNRIVPV
jgi:hypothetical protein